MSSFTWVAADRSITDGLPSGSELVYLETLSVIASRRIGGALYRGPLAGGRAFVYREDADGVPRVDILRFTLRQLSR